MQKKINEILSMINETLVLKYLETIVGFGPRVMKVPERYRHGKEDAGQVTEVFQGTK
jgi:hypothetical protein